MTAETLHDALTLLPADLVAAVEKRRSRGKPALRWQRWAAMAACFVLVFCAGTFAMLVMAPKGGSKSAEAVDMEAAAEAPAALSPAETAPFETQSAGEQDSGSTLIQGSAATSGQSPAPGFPEYAWAQTPYGSAVDISAEPHVILITGTQELALYIEGSSHQDRSALREHKALQEDGWFELYDLVLIRLPAIAGAELLDIRQTETGWTVLLGQQPEGEETSCHLLLTAEKGLVAGADVITVQLEDTP